MFGPDWLSNLFLSIFLFGLIFTIASIALSFIGLGGAHGGHAGGIDAHAGGIDAHLGGIGAHGAHIGDVSGHIGDVGGQGIHIDTAGAHGVHVGGNGHVAHDIGAHPADHDGPGVLNMPTLMAFITWFGGVGYILRESLGWSGYIVTPLALISGATGGTIMFVVLARVLWPMMSQPLSREEFRLPGTLARVVSPIREGGVGEIVYSKRGTRFTAGARSEDDEPIAKGSEVVIIRYEKGLAYVMDVADLRARASDGEVDPSILEAPDVPARLDSPKAEIVDDGGLRVASRRSTMDDWRSTTDDR